MDEETRKALKAIIDPIVNQALTEVHNDAIDLMIRVLDCYPEKVVTIKKVKEIIQTLRR